MPASDPRNSLAFAFSLQAEVDTALLGSSMGTLLLWAPSPIKLLLVIFCVCDRQIKFRLDSLLLYPFFPFSPSKTIKRFWAPLQVSWTLSPMPSLPKGWVTRLAFVPVTRRLHCTCHWELPLLFEGHTIYDGGTVLFCISSTLRIWDGLGNYLRNNLLLFPF